MTELFAQRGRQCGTRYKAPLDRGRSLPAILRRIEQDLEEVRRPDISRRPIMRDRIELLLGIADAAWNDGATKRVRAGFEDKATGREMIREGIVHDLARTKPGCIKSARCSPPIGALTLRFKDGSRRHQQAPHFAGRGHVEPAERRAFFLQCRNIRFAQHRQLRQRVPAR